MDPAVTDIELLTPLEVKKILKVSLSLVYHLADRKQLPCVRIPSPRNNGKRGKSTVRFKKSDLFDFVERHYQ
jgi:hypothetical protein